ncbi:MAG: hypothetical protein KBF37_02315 [Saprospiraceae bacterium]|jgi:regulator of replication initiation timing|nr:hypothetical protein [Saprospiraceae bacterium]MBP9209132.1 hypothetical protein [Saprospiraceae bacterium]MBV6473637.1 hypothetical protein [Saprospiraceae bacterium]
MSTNKSNKSKNLVDLVVETQAKVVDQFVDATRHLTKDVPAVQETLDKGNKIYKEALHAQAGVYEMANEQMTHTAEKMQETSDSVKNFFQHWFENQMNWAKTTFQQSQQDNAKAFSGQPADWTNLWQNWNNQMNGFMSNNMNAEPFFQMMKSNPFLQGNGFQKQWSEQASQWSPFVKSYMELMQSAYGEWWKQMPNTTAAESFQGMQKMASGMRQFYDLWAPLFSAMQQNAFSYERYKEQFNADKYKAFLDSFFSFLPDESRRQMDVMNRQFVEQMKHFAEMGLNNLQQFRSQSFQQPWMSASPFQQMVEFYTNWKQAMVEASSPISRLFEENSNVKNAKVWSELYDKMALLSMKNNELQYMIYQEGIQVMDALASRVTDRLKKGESVDSMVKLFQEWMVLGDEHFTQMFQGDSYSKLMTEVSSLQLSIKKELDIQMEKMFFANLPVATRTEMDEVYKSLYELKKMVRNLERSQGNQDVPEAGEAKTSRKK